ncbi:MAG: hypothetical protein AAGI91_11500 [Bacteroidota bacterium]
MLRFPTLVLLALLLPLAGQAQSAQQVLDDVLDQYRADLAGAENYTLTQTVMGTETMTYAERAEGGGPLDYTYTTYITLPGGQTMSQPAETENMAPLQMLDRIRESARYVGSEDVDGTAAHVIAVDDFGEAMSDMGMMPNAEFEMETVTFFVGKRDRRVVKMTMAGTMKQDGRTSPIAMETRLLDYRTVDGLTVPFRTVMEIQGASGAMDAGEREEVLRELEEAKRQMESMPEAQRQMMERMLGDQMKQAEEMLAGESMQFEMQVTDVQVNAGPPN